MELEVGMYYTRNKDGELGLCKCGNLTPEEYVETYKNTYDIKNASYNIIDLIEEHDYIRIISSAFFEPVYYSYGKLVIRDDIPIENYSNKFIAEVITHEQMESMSYKVGE